MSPGDKTDLFFLSTRLPARTAIIVLLLCFFILYISIKIKVIKFLKLDGYQIYTHRYFLNKSHKYNIYIKYFSIKPTIIPRFFPFSIYIKK